MDQTPPPRLTAPLASAVLRVRQAARAAAEQTVDSLGLAALATHGAAQRDALLGAQYELNRKLALFSHSFDEALTTDVARQTGQLHPAFGPGARSGPTPDEIVASWDALSLVDDHEVEIHLSADRFAQDIGHRCEWEIRELDAYMGSLLHQRVTVHSRNPLRPEVVGQALVRAAEALADRPEVRKVLCVEIGRSLAQGMRQAYADIMAELSHLGIKPLGLSVSHGPSSRATPTTDAATGPGELPPNTSPGSGRTTTQGLSVAGQLASLTAGSSGAQRSGFGQSTTAAFTGAGTLGRVEAGMMDLIRLLAGGGSPGATDWAGALGDDWDAATDLCDPTPGAANPQLQLPAGLTADGLPRVAPNLILAHRDALRQAAGSALDHRVIDVIASLFDQILSDPKVPPQIARQIARLQLPVLRAALGDRSFFSSHRHPVRRFINRIASLGSAVDDFDSPAGHELLQRVADLVQQVLQGDFEQLGLYEHTLRALEAFSASQAQQQVQALGQADALLARKEDELRLRQQFGDALDMAMQDMPVPDFLRQFTARTWSRLILRAELAGQARPGEATDPVRQAKAAAVARQLRDTGRHLLMSVQPKTTPQQRQEFIRGLPVLMKVLNQGLDSLPWTEANKHDFFGQLLPAHAASLKGQALSTLEYNLLLSQVDKLLATPLPDPADASLSPPANALLQAAVQALGPEAAFSATEARTLGLVDEQAVDWDGRVDIDLGAEPELRAVDIQIDGLPPPEPPEPSRGKSLADHVQIGFAYRMHLQGQWQKVRLTHVSPARSFFVFAHGAQQQQVVSMTYRMLTRLCDAGRLRAFENAYLLERATARARRQLAALMPAGRR